MADQTNPGTPSISSSVPGKQEIREADPNTQDVEPMDTNYVITETESFAPVMTVTKSETTLTKGDMKMQKVTVTEDISIQEMENGHSISYTELQTTVVTNEHTEIIEGAWDKGSEEHYHVERKSKIPKLKFKQSVEKVKEERRERKANEQGRKIPRRSSIPKLKDAKLVKRNISLDADTRSGATSLDFEPKIEDEFEKIYEEIVESKQKDVDDKIIAVPIDDPEKIETKFEEIIHAYDSNDDSYLTQKEKLRLSKIPWRKKDDGTSIGSLVEKVKSKNEAASTELKDGGFKVLSSTIRTKRFSRGNSTDVNNIQKVDVVETFDSRNGEGIVKKTVYTESIDNNPVDIETRVSREMIKSNKSDDITSTEEVESSHRVIKETTTRKFKSGIPVKPERISRSISKDLNKRPASLSDRDMVNREVVKHEEFIDGSSKTVIKETITKDLPIGNERITRGISRTFSRDGKSVTVSPKLKEVSSKENKLSVTESTQEMVNVSSPKDTKESTIHVKMETKNGDQTTDDTKDHYNTENSMQGEFLYGRNKTIIKETFVEEIPIINEKITRSISRTFSRDGKSVTLSPKPKEINSTEMKSPEAESVAIKSNGSDPEDHKGIKTFVTDETELKTENINKEQAMDDIKDHSKLENISNDRFETEISPTIKTRHSYGKGHIKHVEISKTFEWKAADEIKTIDSKIESNDDKKSASHDMKNKEDTLVNKKELITTKTFVTDIKELKATDIEKPIKVSTDIVEVNSSRNEVNKEILPKVTNLKEKNKESNMENVTVLKGNVSRLISRISVTEDVSKKEIDVEADLPKKKSVLSKIAMFEGKEPENYSIKIKKCVINKITHTPINTENVDAKPSYDLKEVKQTKLEAVRKDEPVIVDQIWKIKQQTTEIVPVTQNIEEIRVIPGAVDFTTSEINNTFAKIGHDVKTEVKVIKMLPSDINLSEDEKQNELINTLPVQAKELNISTANKLEKHEELLKHNDFISVEDLNNNQANLTERTIDEIEGKPVKVGKLNLNFWQKQVEINKQFVGTDKPIVFTPKIFPDGNVIEKDLNRTEMPTISAAKLEIKTERQVEIPTIVPGSINLTNKFDNNEEFNSKIPKKIELTSNERQLQVPVILPETPLTKSGKMNFDTQRSQIDVPVILPSKIERLTSVNTDKIPESNPGKLDLTTKFIKPVTPTVLPAKINFMEESYQVEHVSEQPKSVEIVYDTSKIVSKANYENENNIETARLLPGKIDRSTSMNIDYISKTPPGKLDLSKYIKTPETPITLPGKINVFEKSFQVERTLDKRTQTADVIEHKTIEFETQHKNESKIEETKIFPDRLDINSNTNDNIIENRELEPSIELDQSENEETDIEIPSDPELVESEPEIKDTKETIMGKLKNKVYLIANLNIAKNIAHEHKVPQEIKDSSSNENFAENSNLNNQYNHESYTKENKGYSSLPYIDNAKREFDLKSDVGLEMSDFNSREDLKRAKSLAELDVGEVVKGQVQRMVYRIKSVDFDRVGTPRRKISLKEMPKKCSVLEKIALFEGKAATTTSERPPKPAKSDPTPRNTTEIPFNVTTVNPEMVYLQKIEDLTTAKVRYGKMEMLYLKLANDVQMPVIALGTALMNNRLLPHIVSTAIDLGYRAIDTAYIYGNEREVGQAIKTKIDDGTVKREDLYIMSKLWSTFHDPALVETACRASLEALGLQYFDLFMIHNPMSLKEGGDVIPKIATVLQFSDYDYLDAWFAMESLVSKGLVRSLGVSNFNSTQIQRILDKGRIRPVVNQVECHPYLSQKRLQSFCSERNITLSCFSVLGSKGTPVEYKTAVPPVIDDPLVQVLAAGLNVTAAQLLVRYQIQSGRNVVVKSSSASHLWDVLQSLTFELKNHEIEALNALNRNKRVFTFKGMGHTHKNYPFHEAF